MNNEIEQIERAANALDRQPLLRAAFAAGGLNLSKVLELIGAEELEHDLGAGRATSGRRVIAPV